MLTLQEIQNAHQRIKPFIHKTPVLTNQYLNKHFNTEIFFKCENFQKAGAFKARGAHHAVFSLTESEAQKGVVTHSSGNHAQALALAAKNRGIKAYIIMPSNAPEVKKNAVKDYGAEIIICEPTLKSREETCNQVARETGAQIIPPYNDVRIIAGQGTAALEFFEVVDDLDYILVPVGGGGLLSGSAIVAKSVSLKTKVIGVEPKGADDAYQSFKSGKLIPQTNPQTIADGLRTSLGDINFKYIQQYVDEIITVEESTIKNAMQLIWERMKIVIEPSSAVPLAALLEEKINIVNKKAGIIVSGGNIDLKNFHW